MSEWSAGVDFIRQALSRGRRKTDAAGPELPAGVTVNLAIVTFFRTPMFASLC
jgi:hypothetical protein